MDKEKLKIVSDICPFYKEYGTCEQCNTALDIDDEPCYFECMANAIIANGYRKQIEGEWKWISDDDCICSACGKVFYSADNADAGTGLWKFCPNCGAKMKGGE